MQLEGNDARRTFILTYANDRYFHTKAKQKLILKKSSKSQSAMEYLMTYGWAILIIAIVIVALYQLGIFGSSNLSPEASAGACQVYRSSATTPQLEGECQGMPPKFVAKFDGSTGYISIPDTASFILDPMNFTESAWFWMNSPSSNNRILGKAAAGGKIRCQQSRRMKSDYALCMSNSMRARSNIFIKTGMQIINLWIRE